MSDWIRLKPPKDLSASSPEGVSFNVLLSPYDIPREIRGGRDPETGYFVIEFRYIGEEPYRREESGNHVWLRIGKNSKRLYGIEVDVAALQTNTVTLQLLQPIHEIIEAKAQDPALAYRKDNYRVALEAIDQTKAELVEN